MDPTMMPVFAVGATLLMVGGSVAAIILTGQRSLRTGIDAVRIRLGKRIDGLDDRVGGLDRRVTLLEAVASRLPGPRWRPALPEPALDESPA